MKEDEKSGYPIHEVVRLFNVNEWTIRFWGNRLHILKPRQNRKGHVMFPPEDVQTIGLISRLTNQKGVMLKDVADAL